MVQAVRYFLEFCYLVRRDTHSESTIKAIRLATLKFHESRNIFIETGVRESISLPRAHSQLHYPSLIREFGAPNRLCSSITESKHIEAVKEPWRRSSRFEAVMQMVLTNQRLGKLAATRADFRARGMLSETCLSEALGSPSSFFVCKS